MNEDDFLKFFASQQNDGPIEHDASTREGLALARSGAQGLFAMLKEMTDAGFTRKEAFELIKITLTLGALSDE